MTNPTPAPGKSVAAKELAEQYAKEMHDGNSLPFSAIRDAIDAAFEQAAQACEKTQTERQRCSGFIHREAAEFRRRAAAAIRALTSKGTTV